MLRKLGRPVAMCLRASMKQSGESQLILMHNCSRKITTSRNLPTASIIKSNFKSNTLHAKREFSSPTTPPSAFETNPPSELNLEMAQGVQKATLMYIRHGLGRRRLDDLAKQAEQESDSRSTLVTRWQRMMEVFLGTQVHVLAGLGYPATEQGIAVYNQQLAMLMQTSSPDIQEILRVKGRDLWREVLSLAFGLNKESDFDLSQLELSIVDARNMMHTISQRMQDPDILEKVAQKAASIPASSSENENITFKHTAVQEVLVHDVYLGKAEGKEQTLVEECGFGSGEKGYVKLQCVMAEHQQDPLVTQYMGGAMIKLMEAAGIDLAGLQQKMQEQQTK